MTTLDIGLPVRRIGNHTRKKWPPDRKHTRRKPHRNFWGRPRSAVGQLVPHGPIDRHSGPPHPFPLAKTYTPPYKRYAGRQTTGVAKKRLLDDKFKNKRHSKRTTRVAGRNTRGKKQENRAYNNRLDKDKNNLPIAHLRNAGEGSRNRKRQKWEKHDRKRNDPTHIVEPHGKDTTKRAWRVALLPGKTHTVTPQGIPLHHIPVTHNIPMARVRKIVAIRHGHLRHRDCNVERALERKSPH